MSLFFVLSPLSGLKLACSASAVVSILFHQDKRQREPKGWKEHGSSNTSLSIWTIYGTLTSGFLLFKENKLFFAEVSLVNFLFLCSQTQSLLMKGINHTK